MSKSITETMTADGQRWALSGSPLSREAKARITFAIQIMDNDGRKNAEGNSLMLWERSWDELRECLLTLLLGESGPSEVSGSPSKESLAKVTLQVAAQRFLDKFDKLEPAMVGAFSFMANHGCEYQGETWEIELADFRAALLPSEPEPAKCETCGGSKELPGTLRIPCHDCACEGCGGLGHIGDRPCPECEPAAAPQGEPTKDFGRLCVRCWKGDGGDSVLLVGGGWTHINCEPAKEEWLRSNDFSTGLAYGEAPPSPVEEGPEKRQPCGECSGSGVLFNGKRPVPCDECEGTKVIPPLHPEEDALYKDVCGHCGHMTSLSNAQRRITELVAKVNALTGDLSAACIQVERLKALAERLKLEAQMHAQEARTQRGTVQRIYQAVTGSTGEPGDWNSEKPVVEKLAELEAEVEKLKAKYSKLDDEFLKLVGERTDLEAEADRLRHLLTAPSTSHEGTTNYTGGEVAEVDRLRGAVTNVAGIAKGHELEAEALALEVERLRAKPLLGETDKKIAALRAEVERWEKAAFLACAGVIATPENPSKDPVRPSILKELRAEIERREEQVSKLQQDVDERNVREMDLRMEVEKLKAELVTAKLRRSDDVEFTANLKAEVERLRAAATLSKSETVAPGGAPGDLERLRRDYLICQLGWGSVPGGTQEEAREVRERLGSLERSVLTADSYPQISLEEMAKVFESDPGEDEPLETGKWFDMDWWLAMAVSLRAHRCGLKGGEGRGE